MTEKIYLETFEKCPGLVCFPLLIDTNRSLLKSKYNTDKLNSEKKIPDPNGLLKNKLQS